MIFICHGIRGKLWRKWCTHCWPRAVFRVHMMCRSEEHTSELQSRGHLVCRESYPLSLHDALPILGLSGAQGTGKSTAAEILTRALTRRGWRVCQLSLDDLYLSRHQRQTLAQVVHPLLATRGVPGTHDVSLGLTVLEQLRTAGPVTTTYLPRFDKAADEPKAHDQWSVVRGRPELIILDGWCLGARPQPAEALLAPCNELEAQEDTDGLWRRYVDARLHAYQT